MAALFTRACLFNLLFIFFFSGSVFSQINLSGRVEDETSQQPIANASVYFNGTTTGTYTDQEGGFKFENMRLINTDIIVFSPGYELLIFKPVEKNIQGRKVVFRLQRKEVKPGKLQIERESGKQAIIVFKEALLGLTREANECEILNEDAIYILPGETATEYKLISDTPLIIVNRRLGYRINYNLLEYSIDILNGVQRLYGFVLYNELGNPHVYSSNRKKVYKGSTLHFFRSLVNHQLYQQQFETFWMKPVSDTAIINSPPSNFFLTNTDTALLEPVKPQDLLFIDSSNELTVRLSYKLLVYFGKNPAGKDYMLANGLREGFAIKGIQSYLRFSTPSIGINYKGVLDDYSNVEYAGYWSYELLANKLPLNYDPDN